MQPVYMIGFLHRVFQSLAKPFRKLNLVDENNKDFPEIVTGAALVYAFFVLLVGGLFTLMLLFGEPVAQG